MSSMSQQYLTMFNKDLRRSNTCIIVTILYVQQRHSFYVKVFIIDVVVLKIEMFLIMKFTASIIRVSF